MDKTFPACKGDEAYVFVCYAHEDAGVVYPEIARLHDDGTNVWYDEGISPGHEWTQELADAIEGCSHFLYFVTPRSVQSRNCRNELQYATSRHKRILAIHLEPTKLPGGLQLSIGLDQAILKHQLGDDVYRSKLVAALGAQVSAAEQNKAAAPSRISSTKWLLAVAAVLVMAGSAWFWQVALQESQIGMPEPAAVAGAPITAIAVMPFEDLNPTQDREWFATGMAAELIESLGRIEGLHVPSRNSTELLAHQGADLATIGAALTVGSVVSGTVLTAGERLNVMAEWTRIADSARLWSARYERRADELLDVQREIAVGIAEAIRTELGVDDATSSPFLRERYRTSDPRAWALTQQAWDLFQTWERENWPAARLLARDALALDPNYAVAHALLGYYEVDDPEARLRSAFRALQIDPSDAWSNIILIEDSLARWDYATAETLLDRALANDPGNSLLHWEAFFIYGGTERADAALAAAQRMVQLDPLWPAWHMHHGFALEDVGQLPRALEAYLEGRRLMEVRGPGYQPFFNLLFALTLARSHHAVGDDSAAMEASLHPAGLRVSAMSASDVTEAWRTGGWEGYHQLVLTQIPADNILRCSWLAADDAEPERTYDCLARLLAGTTGPWQTRTDLNNRRQLARALQVDSAFAPYRSDPRFQQMRADLQARMAAAAGTYPLPSELR